MRKSTRPWVQESARALSHCRWNRRFTVTLSKQTYMELIEVDDWAPEEVVVLVEVPHTDCEVVTIIRSAVLQMPHYIVCATDPFRSNPNGTCRSLSCGGADHRPIRRRWKEAHIQYAGRCTFCVLQRMAASQVQLAFADLFLRCKRASFKQSTSGLRANFQY